MYVIPPLPVTDARFTSSTVVETAPAAYAGGTTYALNDTASVAGAAGLITTYRSLQGSNTGHTPSSSPTWWVDIGNTYQVYSGAATYALADRVIDATTHKVYESLIAGNIGQALTDTTKWLYLGATNKWAIFDYLRNVKTIVPTTMTFVLTPGTRVDAIALTHLIANSVSITIVSNSVTVYSYSETLTNRFTDGWYSYFFGEFSNRENVLRLDLPPYVDAIITVTLTATSGNVQCGGVVLGMKFHLGTAQYDAESDVLNFSTVVRDFDGGTAVLTQRRNIPKTNQRLFVEKTRIDAIAEFREHNGALPCYWTALDDATDDWFYILSVIGIYKKFVINAALPDYATIDLELEGIS